MEIAKRRIGGVKQCPGRALPDFNSTPERQPAASLGYANKECSNLFGYQKAKTSFLASGF